MSSINSPASGVRLPEMGNKQGPGQRLRDRIQLCSPLAVTLVCLLPVSSSPGKEIESKNKKTGQREPHLPGLVRTHTDDGRYSLTAAGSRAGTGYEGLGLRPSQTSSSLHPPPTQDDLAFARPNYSPPHNSGSRVEKSGPRRGAVSRLSCYAESGL